jgi:hypothetical protein
LRRLRFLIEVTRSFVAVTVHSALTMLYWLVGKQISKEFLQEERATYVPEILPTLSAKLAGVILSPSSTQCVPLPG